VTLPRLYVVLDSDVAERFRWSIIDLARACLAGGARLLQVRAKHLAAGPMVELCERVVAEARPANARVIVNDRGDVARLADAAGVHVGQDDLTPDLVRRVVGPDLFVGLSTHTRDQVARALASPIDYLAVGPVFDTATKETGYERVGLDLVRLAAAEAAPVGMPVVAIGGITLEQAPNVLEAGAASVAVISDLLTGGDPEGRTRAFVARLG
jgi:thiamine-phosphate pyrophosphorylase